MTAQDFSPRVLSLWRDDGWGGDGICAHGGLTVAEGNGGPEVADATALVAADVERDGITDVNWPASWIHAATPLLQSV